MDVSPYIDMDQLTCPQQWTSSSVSDGSCEQFKTFLPLDTERGAEHGSIQLKDNASAHLGDRYNVANTFNINQTTFSSQTLGPVDKIAAWLTPANHNDYQNDIFSRVTDGTGKWFLERHEYKQWVLLPGKNLLINGVPGAGKTHLVSIIINDLRNALADCNDTLLLFFYNSFQRKHEQSAVSMISCLLRQAFLHSISRAESIQDLCDRHCKNGQASRPTLSELVQTLSTVFAGYKRVYLVIDALDECISTDLDSTSQRNTFLRTLNSLQQNSGDCISITVTRRSSRDMILDSERTTALYVKAHDDDISKYALSRLYVSRRQIFRDPDVQQRVADALMRSSKGM